MTNKQRLQAVLNGQIPDAPPTWELVFDIEKTCFGMDDEAVRNATYSSEKAAEEAWWSHRADVYRRLVEELGWAAVPGGHNPKQVAFFNRQGLGEKALLVGFEGQGVFWMPSGDEIMDFVVRLFEQPEDLHAEARRRCDLAKELFAQFVDAGADFLLGTYDFGFNDAPFISPQHFAEFVAPYLTELVEEAHSLGKKFILHSDGCLTKILDQIHATGIDGYQSVDPQGHMDIAVVRERYPDWLLMGNVACNMLQDTHEASIRESVRYCMKHGGMGKRYVFSTSNCVFRGMPPESYRIMLDEYRRLIGETRPER